VTAQQIGSGVYGIGVGSFGLDWVSSARSGHAGVCHHERHGRLLPHRLRDLAHRQLDRRVQRQAKQFPIISPQVFMANGSAYDVNQVLDQSTFQFNQARYDGAGQINLSIFFAFTYGLSFATLAATLSRSFMASRYGSRPRRRCTSRPATCTPG
jgi:hypothetical protein